jgi:hypothetical protein
MNSERIKRPLWVLNLLLGRKKHPQRLEYSFVIMSSTLLRNSRIYLTQLSQPAILQVKQISLSDFPICAREIRRLGQKHRTPPWPRQQRVALQNISYWQRLRVRVSATLLRERKEIRHYAQDIALVSGFTLAWIVGFWKPVSGRKG